MAEERRVYLEVNEVIVHLYGSRSAAHWWQMYRLRFKDTDRIETITSSIPGDRVRVACDDREHAESLKATALTMGVPASALKVGVV